MPKSPSKCFAYSSSCAGALSTSSRFVIAFPPPFPSFYHISSLPHKLPISRGTPEGVVPFHCSSTGLLSYPATPRCPKCNLLLDSASRGRARGQQTLCQNQRRTARLARVRRSPSRTPPAICRTLLL